MDVGFTRTEVGTLKGLGLAATMVSARWCAGASMGFAANSDRIWPFAGRSHYLYASRGGRQRLR